MLEISLPDEVVQKLVGEAFNRLDPSAQKVMQALAVYNRPVSPAAIDYLLQPHLPSIDSALVLNRLVNMHFARREAGRYYLHPADKEYAFSLISVGENREQKVVNSESPEPPTTNPQSLVSDNLPFTQHDLLNRAADYFAQARKPRAEWKKLDDLNAQLAEFELRCEAGDYDTAAGVLLEIDFNYLLLWGHYRLMIELHEKLIGKIKDLTLARINIGNLGHALSSIGKIKEAISNYEKALVMARQAKNRQAEGTWLGNLGNAYDDLGDSIKAIEFDEQALFIARETGNRVGEENSLQRLGVYYANLGNMHKAIEFHEQALVIAREIGNRTGEGSILGSMGSDYKVLGNIEKAIEYQEIALMIAQEIGDRRNESSNLSNLGNRYSEIAEYKKAIEYYEKSILIKQEIGDRSGEANSFGNTGDAWVSLGEYQKAKESYQQAIKIADDISFPQTQSYARQGLTEVYLIQNNLVNARTTIEVALQYDVLENNHNASALHGIIALRQGERKTAQEAFMKSIAQADEILAKTPDYYSALDAKGLALCGAAIAADDGRQTVDRGKTIAEAVETFKKARTIAPHAGVVKPVLRLFDELVKCEGGEILKDVRKAVEGVG
ncbi:MAG: tetratricopeptide repeat protein [Anaerolineales bacterium]|nr:tetratricopeptide repeat protein [Anaerolineales bacterium]